MAEGICGKCSRYLLIVFNFLFWISGGALLGVGIWIRVDTEIAHVLKNYVNVELPLDVLYSAAYVLMAVGAFIFITGFCGCCGAIRESACMLIVYIACLIVVMVAELAAGIYLAVERTNIEHMIQDNLSIQVENYSPGNSSNAMDYLQKQFNCCGSKNYTEYRMSNYYANKTDVFVPESCCNAVTLTTTNPEKKYLDLCQQEAREHTTSPKQLRNLGCYNEILDFLVRNGAIIIGVVVGIACLEMLGIIFAACLIRNRTDYDQYFDE